MRKGFINHTNHPSDRWSSQQLLASEKYGEIIDVLFPSIGADDSSEEVKRQVEIQLNIILKLNPAAVLCQGEFSYTYHMVNELKKNGITVLAACSQRVVIESHDGNGNTIKKSQFFFTQYREY